MIRGKVWFVALLMWGCGSGTEGGSSFGTFGGLAPAAGGNGLGTGSGAEDGPRFGLGAPPPAATAAQAGGLARPTREYGGYDQCIDACDHLYECGLVGRDAREDCYWGCDDGYLPASLVHCVVSSDCRLAAACFQG